MAHPDRPGMAQSNRTWGERALIPLNAEPKSAAWKIALAAWLKRGSSVFNRWIAEQLNRGAPNAVGRYVDDVNRADRAAAVEKLHELSTKVRG